MTDIRIDLKNLKTDLEKEHVASFLAQLKPVKIIYSKAFSENQLSGSYDPIRHEANLKFIKHVHFSTDSDLGIFGGIYKRTFTRFYYTIFP